MTCRLAGRLSLAAATAVVVFALFPAIAHAASNIPGDVFTPPSMWVSMQASGQEDSVAVCGVYLERGWGFMFEVPSAPSMGMWLYRPTAQDVYNDPALVYNGTPRDDGTLTLYYVAPASGIYYIVLQNRTASAVNVLLNYEFGISTSLSLVGTDSVSVAHGAQAGPSARLTDYFGTPLAQQPIQVYAATPGTDWNQVGLVYTNQSGIAAYRVAVEEDTAFFMYYAGDALHWDANADRSLYVHVLAGPIPTSINIRTSATVASIGRTVVLSGDVQPQSMVGVNIVVYVKKPGKTYWTYSSNRTVYSLSGLPAWQYKYLFKPGMVKGAYVFKSAAPAPGFASSAGFGNSESPGTVTIRLR